MIKADLITGFLGSGKTTFIKQYALFLVSLGEKVCILENDFGAINIDMMLLQDLKDKGIDFEMIAGGCDYDCHKRRFKTKLITISMLGYTRVIIEPSGLFDVDEFFDIVHEDEVYERVKVNNVIAVVDASRLDLNEKSKFIFASQIACSGKVVLTHTDCLKEFKIEDTVSFINESLKSIDCKRVLTTNDFIQNKDKGLLNETDLKLLSESSYKECSYTKKYNLEDLDYDSLFFMDSSLNLNELKEVIVKLFDDQKCGKIDRIKGFVNEDGNWYELNYNHESMSVNKVKDGQKIIIVIGENLNSEYIDSFIPSANSSYSVIENIRK